METYLARNGVETPCSVRDAPSIRGGCAEWGVNPSRSWLGRDAGAGADQPAIVERLGQLHGVRRRALAEVVGDDPQVERAVVALVVADAPDEDLVAAGGVE